MRRALLGLTVVALLLASCGDDDAETTTDTTETSETTETTEDSSADDTTSSTTSSSTPAPGDLPGERIELFPYEGAALAVVSVEADDVLNVRAGPGVDFDVVAELEPLAEGFTATGHNRSIDDDSIWAEVTVDGDQVTGWANTAFLGQPATVNDITTELYPEVADRPTAETMLELGRQVAEQRAGEGEPEPTITVVDGPSVGDLGEIVVDVMGYPDDSVLGERLHVFAEPDPGGESFTVRTVESTTMCRRGVTDGLCV